MKSNDNGLGSAAIEFVEALELPEFKGDEGLEAAETKKLVPDFKLPIEEVVTVGSQIAGFAASVGPEIRPHIANAFLLAQLAANKKISNSGGNSRTWYNAYMDVLKSIGWVVEGDAKSFQEVHVKNFDVHAEILPIIEMALGPAVAATALITTVLKGLSNMDKNAPWLTLFSRESQRAKANQFQISNTTGTTSHPSIKLVGFELDASASVTQVLFFKFTSNKAKLRKFDVSLSVNAAVFMQVKESIQKKLADRIVNYVAKIEI